MASIPENDADAFYSLPQFQSFFKSSPSSLIIRANAPDFLVVAVSDNYLMITGKQRDELLNKNMFEVLPGSRRIPAQKTIVSMSLLRVIMEKRTDVLPTFAYEIDDNETGGKKTEYWSSINDPVFDDEGNVSYIVNTTANITALVLWEAAKLEEEKRKAKRGEDSSTREEPMDSHDLLKQEAVKEKNVKDELIKLYRREQLLNEELSASNEELNISNAEMQVANMELHSMRDDLMVWSGKLAESEEHLRLSTEAANIGMFSFDLGNLKLTVSAHTRKIFGLPKDGELEQVDITSVIDDTHIERVQAMVRRTIDLPGIPYFDEYPITRKSDSAKRWVRALGNVRRSRQSGMNVFTGVVIDITEQKTDEQRKNDFINIVSHELKTPLTTLSGYLQVLSLIAADGNALHESLLYKAKKQTDRMATMINSFLNVSRLDNAKIEIDKTRFDLCDLLRETEEEMRSLYTTHTLIFHPTHSIEVTADRNKIAQVMQNLISNAIKYSVPGSAISVSCSKKDDVAKICVQDEGIGIAAVEVPKVFDRYYRVKGKTTQDISGFGIGLYLCAEIISRHDGMIWGESVEGHGSTFCFTLPYMAA